MARLGVIALALSLSLSFPARLKQDTTLLTSIRGWRRKTPRHRRQTPFLDIRFDENEAGLAEVDVHGARAVCADGGEEVLSFETVGYVVEFFAVASEEDGARAGAVADAYNVALDVGGAVRGRCEGLIVAAGTEGGVGYGGLVPAWGELMKW